MPITFGVPREQEDFVARNARFLEVFPRLTRRIDEILALRSFAPGDRQESESEDDWTQRAVAQRLVFFLGRLAAEDFMEIVLLCGNGYGMGGLKLLRPMFEAVVTGLYIGRHPEEAKAFMKYNIVHQRKFLKVAEAAGIDLSAIVPGDEQARIEREYLDTRDSYRLMRCPECDAVLNDVSWTKRDPLAMARELGLHELAVQCYSYTTLHIHTTPTRLFSRLEETPDAIQFKAGPQHAEADAALIGAHCCIAHVLEGHSRYFDLGIGGLEHELSDGIAYAWGDRMSDSWNP